METDRRRFVHFSAWMLGCVSAFAVGYVLLGLAYRDVPTLAGAAAIAWYAGGLALVRHRLAQGGTLEDAAAAAGRRFLLAVVAVAVLQPRLADALALATVLGVLMPMPYRTGRIRADLIGAGAALMVVVALDEIWRVPSLLPPLLVEALRVSQALATGALACLLVWHEHQRQRTTIAEQRMLNTELEHTQALLARDREALRVSLGASEDLTLELERQLHELASARQVIRELSVPVLPIGDTLIVPLIGALDTARLIVLGDAVLAALEQRRARRVVLELSGVPLVDSQVAQGLAQTVRAAQMLGAEAVLVGIRPEVAQAVVSLGLDLRIRAVRSLADALGATTGVAGQGM